MWVVFLIRLLFVEDKQIHVLAVLLRMLPLFTHYPEILAPFLYDTPILFLYGYFEQN